MYDGRGVRDERKSRAGQGGVGQGRGGRAGQGGTGGVVKCYGRESTYRRIGGSSWWNRPTSRHKR